jgi:ferredoxin--NADP+ reductase
MVGTLTNWIAEQPEDLSELKASRRLHLHFLHSPVEIYDDAENPGRVSGMKFERTELDGTGNARGTGEYTAYPGRAVCRAIGYFGSALPEIEFDHKKGVVPNAGGRVLDASGEHVPGIYATGWIKRGPVGLIGHTKGDALEPVTYLLADRENLPVAEAPAASAVVDLLESRGVQYTSWEGWLALDAHELALGAEATAAGGSHGVEVKRERIKVVPREDMVAIARDGAAASV